jgi:putative endonuclease
MKWYVYIARCADNSLYTGITTNLERRIREHNSNNYSGAKSLRYRRPVKLVYYEQFANQTQAAVRERAIKKWTRKYKLKLITAFKKIPQ